jgi:hypothetical protein
MRILLSVLLLLWGGYTQAATWYIQNIHDNRILGQFDFTIIDEAVNPFTGETEYNLPSYENIFFKGLGPEARQFYNAGTIAGTTASHLHAFESEYSLLDIVFSEALTMDAEEVGLEFIGLAWDGNWCYENPICISWTPENYVATTMPEVPLPTAAWLFLSAVSGLGLVKRVRK